MRQHLMVRLRPGRDQDLIDALQGICQEDVSELIRKGLRIVLDYAEKHDEPQQNVTTTQQQEMAEQVIEQQPKESENELVERREQQKVKTVWKFPT